MPARTVSYENSLLRLRFIGGRLNTHSVPIYELGQSLVAIQRMVHKAHLMATEQEAIRPYLSSKERAALSLQLAGRRQSSDAYGLIPFLNSQIAAVLPNYMGGILTALTIYATGRILGRHSQRRDNDYRLSVFVFNQVDALTKRIGNIGEIDAIELNTGDKTSERKQVVLDKETKNYVNEIRNKMAHGPIEVIEGKVVDFMPNDNAVKITRSVEGIVKVLLSERDFQAVRYSNIRSPLVRITGEPMYRLGVETYRYEAFDAHSLEILGSSEEIP